MVYFSMQDKNYITAIKATRDKDELYLTTIYQVDDKRFKKELRKIEKDH